MSYFAKFRSSGKFQERPRKTYILPTLYGVAFGVTCILLLGIAFASTNNGVYFLCFMLTVLGVQSLVVTNRNTEHLEIDRIEVEDFFADETGFAKIAIANRGDTGLHRLTLMTKSFARDGEVPVVVTRMLPGERHEVQLPLKISSAGLHSLPPITVASEFPFYFARSWKKIVSQYTFAVFPARLGQSEFPVAAFADVNLLNDNPDEFKSHREYASADSPRRIDWKVTARVQKLMVKEFDQQTATKITLRWDDCPQTSAAEKKSQLSLWIDLAEKKNYEYALVLPTVKMELGHGPQHRLNCLRALL